MVSACPELYGSFLSKKHIKNQLTGGRLNLKDLTKLEIIMEQLYLYKTTEHMKKRSPSCLEDLVLLQIALDMERRCLEEKQQLSNV